MQNKLGEIKFYKVKNPKREFFCALCDSPRQMKYSRNLKARQYFQIFIFSAVCCWLLFPLMSYKVVYLIFINWLLFEVVHKSLYRKELPCPYCGFDPTWYRRDVKVAKKLVHEFWQKKENIKVSKDRPLREAAQNTVSPPL